VTGGTPLTSSVVGTTTSLPGTVAGERTAASTARTTGYTDSKSLSVNAAAATVAISPALTTLTPAQQQTYTLTVTIPANTKLYDVYVSATLPDSMVFDSHGFDQCTSGCVGVGATPQFNKYDIVSGNANSQVVGWDLGDLTTTTTAPRVISLPFTAHLLATKRGSGAPGTPIVRTNAGTVPAVVSSNRTNKQVFPFSSASPPSLTYVFDDSSPTAAAAFTVVEPVLKVDKTEAVNNFTYVDGPLTVHDGDTLRYKITITNSGDQPAYDITIKDTPDARITNVQMSSGLSTTANTLANGGHPWTGPGDFIAWSVGSAGLAPGASVSVDYTASLPAVTTMHQGTTFTNTANLQAAYGLSGATRAAHGGTAFVYRNYSVANYPTLADSTTVKYDHPSLSIVKTTGASGFPKTAPGQIDHPFTWRVVVTNTSATAAATKLTITDTLPKNWTYEPGTSAFTSGVTSEPTVATNSAGDQLTWATNNGLAAGASTTLTYQARPTFASIASNGTGATHPHTNTANASVLDAVGAPADADGPFVPASADTANATIDLPSITFTDTPDGGAAKAGETVPFHVKVSNTGTVEATNVVVTDTLPLGTTYVSGSATATPPAGFTQTSYTPEVPASGTTPAVPGTVTFRVATLAGGANVDIAIPVRTDPASPSGTVVTNHAVVQSAQTAQTADDPGTVTLTPSADLQAAKTAQVGGTTVTGATAGAHLQYVIGATNKGPSVATAIVLKDQLPSTVTLVAGSLPSQCTSGPTTPATTPATVTVTCTFTGATAVSDSVSATIDTVVNAGVTTNANNTVKASSSTPDPVATNDTATANVAVGTNSDLSVVQSVVGATPDPHAGRAVNGTTGDLKLAVHNDGPSDATGVKVVDTLPAGLTFVSSASGCTASGQAITCTIGSLLAGADATVTLTVRATTVGPQLATAVVSSNAAVDPAANNTDSATVTVDPAADLALALSAPATVPATGDTTYALTATNAGPNDATGVTVTQTLPAGTIFVSGDPGCTATGITVTCVVGALASGAHTTVQVKAHVPVELGATAITTNASVAGTETDLAPGDNVASGSTQVGPVADIQLTQTGPNSITAGGTYTFTLSVHNDGPSDAPDVDVTDTLPQGVTGHRLTGARIANLEGRAAGRAATPSQGSCAESSGTVLCHLGTLPAGASTLITVAVDIPESMGDATITNLASATSSIPDPKPNNAAASYSTKVLVKPTPPPVVQQTPDPPVVLPAGSANLSIAKQAEGVARANRELRYQITATNHGPSVADNVVVDDALLNGVQYRAYQSSDSRCAFTGGTLHCKLGSLKVGEVTAIHVTVVPTKTGQLVNNATIASDTNDPITSDNRAVAQNAVSPLPPTKLSLVTTTSSKRVRGGARVTYALKVKNVGKNTASNMQVCNRVPAQLAFTSTKGGVLNGSRLCFTQKSLAPGKRAVFKVRVRVAARAKKGFIVNRAFADAENASTQNASVKSQVITDGKVSPAAVHGFTG
ncbi:MAG: hypothetical protein REI11_17260, partial [Patulibacter sp.]|nr:hypothetical protein [Patulibacter sp.]